ncbi:hypothetical protein CH75_24060 [Dyella jiangningensis]|nr:hypothetical protein CH75_00980 [Dyella jiangningensis]AHX16500.1 hypothetical protein CH75_24060 [Dyella jiangningensis]
MTTDPHLSSNHLLRDFDVLLDQHQRVQKENDLLRIELMRHPSGAMQIRSVERSLGRAYRDIHSEPGGIASAAYSVE